MEGQMSLLFSSQLKECRYCPECGTDWQGEPISEESLKKGYYGEWNGEPRFYSRLIGISDWEKDRTVAWMCPDCHKEWPR